MPSSSALPSSQFELADTVQLDQADNAVLAQLERVKALLADRQWDEAVEILRQLSESSEGKLLGVTSRRYVGPARLVPAAVGLAAARGTEALPRPRRSGRPRDGTSKGLPSGTASCCKTSSQQAFASSYGDDGPDGPGRDGVGVGRLCAARWDWERIVPTGKKGTGTFCRNGPEGAAQKRTCPLFPVARLSRHEARSGRRSCAAGAGVDSRRCTRAGAGRVGRNWPGCTPTPAGGWAAAKGNTPICWRRCSAESASWPATAARSRLAHVRRQFRAKQDRAAADRRRRGDVAHAVAAGVDRCRIGRWNRRAAGEDPPSR